MYTGIYRKLPSFSLFYYIKSFFTSFSQSSLSASVALGRRFGFLLRSLRIRFLAPGLMSSHSGDGKEYLPRHTDLKMSLSESPSNGEYEHSSTYL